MSPLDAGLAARRDVDVWLFTLDCPADLVLQLAQTLDAEEQARAARFHFPRDRRRHVVARAVMRQVLGAALGRAVTDVRFDYNAWGKPLLADAAAPHFNLSHTAELGALAVAWAGPVGVDIEAMRAIEPEVARQHFSTAEQAELAQLTGDAWTAGFYRCWTRKEAVIKALGLGLAQPLDSFDVTLAPEAPARLLRLKGQPDAPARWRLQHMDPAPHICGAVATPWEPAAVNIRHWSPQIAGATPA